VYFSGAVSRLRNCSSCTAIYTTAAVACSGSCLPWRKQMLQFVRRNYGPSIGLLQQQPAPPARLRSISRARVLCSSSLKPGNYTCYLDCKVCTGLQLFSGTLIYCGCNIVYLRGQ
jgi:hypothetical protein